VLYLFSLADYCPAPVAGTIGFTEEEAAYTGFALFFALLFGFSLEGTVTLTLAVPSL